MAQSRREPSAADPDNVPETLCVGRFNLAYSGPLATLTFTHVRCKAGPLIDEGRSEAESIVRARIVTTIENLRALRDLLNQATAILGEGAKPGSASSGARVN